MTQTNAFVISFKGLNFDIEPIEIRSPSGKENNNVAMVKYKEPIIKRCIIHTYTSDY